MKAARARAGSTGFVLVAAVALARADASLIGAVAPSLRADLHLDDARLGLLASLASITGALCALPAGRLIDRRDRRIVISVALLLWSLALGIAGLATGVALFAFARLLSGAIATVARPAAVSVIGERHPRARRGRALAVLDAWQTAGSVVCFLVVAASIAVASWRLAFFVFAAFGLLLAFGASRLPVGRVASPGPASEPLSAWALLHIPTNVVALVADSVGNFFFAGATSFTVLFVTERFGFSTAEVDALAPCVGLAAIAGILGGGRFGDRLARRSGGSRRIVVAASCDVGAAGALIPALVSRSVGMCAVSLAMGAFLLGAAGPCLDAVRVDVVAPGLRGRAEATRGLLTLASSALGPVTFGLLAGVLGGRSDHGAGLADAFLVMLVPLAASGLILLAALSRYERDAAAAGAGEADDPNAAARSPTEAR